MTLHFLLQADDVTLMEKRAVRQAAMLSDAMCSTRYLADMEARLPDANVITPVGTVEFVLAMARCNSIPLPGHLSYPPCLCSETFLRRRIWEGKWGEAEDDEFVKPLLDIKFFTGALRRDITEAISDDYPVWISEPVSFLCEWRYYILNSQIVGAGRYDDGEDDCPEPDLRLVQRAVDVMCETGAPAGYALDFGVLHDGQTALVEANDGWALGFYRGSCSPSDYAALLHTRWQEIVGCR